MLLALIIISVNSSVQLAAAVAGSICGAAVAGRGQQF